MNIEEAKKWIRSPNARPTCLVLACNQRQFESFRKAVGDGSDGSVRLRRVVSNVGFLGFRGEMFWLPKAVIDFDMYESLMAREIAILKVEADL